MQLQAKVIVTLGIVGAVAGTSFFRSAANGSLRPVDQATLASVTVEKAQASERTVSARGPQCACGDMDANGSVNLNDFATFGVCFGLAGPNVNCDAQAFFCSDMNADGTVNLNDFGTFALVFGGPPSGTVPACVPGSRRPDPPGTNVAEVECVPPSLKSPCITTDAYGETDPVYLFSGEFYHTVVDLQIRGRGLNFTWSRRYQSQRGPNTAMGNGWDFSYNIFVESSGADLLLHNGHGREDLYLSQGGGAWLAGEFFREFRQNPDSSYTLEFQDKGRWEFHPLNGSSEQGRIRSMVDRNGNEVGFEYDPSGRLTTIHDSLDTAAHNRDITIAYNPDGFIESVTDFVGRQVQYQYYGTGDPDGSPGDLKSVRSPLVLGTPTGNDFPTGKTEVYTYSTLFANDLLNHNLLTITDPKGQTYLVNTYSSTLNPADFGI